MSKYDYFGELETLSRLSTKAVQLACDGKKRTGVERASELRRAADRTVCALEDALFSDFMPPLERDGIAACAHCLCRVVNEASELLPPLSEKNFANEEGEVCVRLAERLEETVIMLRALTRPDKTPDVQGFRQLLCEGRQAHGRMLCALRTEKLPRRAASAIIQTGRLRTQLAESFDRVIEVMLENI